MKTDLFFRLFAFGIAMAVPSACNEKVESYTDVEDDRIKLKVVVPVKETKLTGASDEARINNYQVYVFDDGGVLESYTNQASSEIVLDCTAGAKTVAVLTNAPSMNDVTTLSVLASKVSLLSDNSGGSFVMAGQQAVTVSADKEVTVTVSRLVAKVKLSSLQVEFEAPQYRALPFKVAAVYLINVPAETKYFSGISPSVWYNKQKYVSTDANALIYDDMKNTAVGASSPYSSVNTFYCYPNPSTQDSFSTTWSARHTRLVVEAYLGTAKYYYPVTLPALEKNRIYDVKLTITMPGTSTPDEEVDKYAADFSITVKSWDTGASVVEEI